MGRDESEGVGDEGTRTHIYIYVSCIHFLLAGCNAIVTPDGQLGVTSCVDILAVAALASQRCVDLVALNASMTDCVEVHVTSCQSHTHQM